MRGEFSHCQPLLKAGGAELICRMLAHVPCTYERQVNFGQEEDGEEMS